MNILRWISKMPLRKPLVVLVVLVSLVIVVVSVCRDVDIPSNTASFMNVFVITVIGSYFASSSFEACNKKEGDFVEDQSRINKED